MGRTYAGILGLLAYATVTARGLVAGGTMENVLKAASISLFAFAALGYLFGRIAEATITQSLRQQLDEQRVENEQRKSAGPRKQQEVAPSAASMS